MKAAPYCPATLVRIRAGATAADLGWDSAMYASVCRRHAIAPNASPQPMEPRPLVAPLKSLEMTKREKVERRQASASSLIGPVYYDKRKREVHRDGVIIELRNSNAAMFEMLAAAPDGEVVAGPALAERIGIAPGSTGNFMASLRLALATVNVGVHGKVARHLSGYSLIDLNSKKRIAIERIEKMRSGASA